MEKEVDWRRLARDRNVSEDVARKLWDKAQAQHPQDPERAFHQLLDAAAANNASREPGRETLVDPRSPRDASSLGPGKTTRVLEEQPKTRASSLHQDLVNAVSAGKNAIEVIAKSDKATIVEALQMLQAKEGGLFQKLIRAAGPAIQKALDGKQPDGKAQNAEATNKPATSGTSAAAAPSSPAAGPRPAKKAPAAATSSKTAGAVTAAVAPPAKADALDAAAPAKPPVNASPAPSAQPAHSRDAGPTPAVPSTPAVDNAALAAVHTREVAKITASFATSESELRAHSLGEQAQIAAAAAAKAVELMSTLDQRIATAQTMFGTARANVLTTARVQASLARRDAQEAAAKLRSSIPTLKEQAVHRADEESAKMNEAAHQAGRRIVTSATQTRAIVGTLVQAGFAVVEQRLKGSDRDATHAALKTAGEHIGDHCRDRALEDADDLVAQAAEHGKQLHEEAHSLFDDQSASQLAELEQAILAGGEKLAGHIESGAQRALADLVRGEQQYLSKLSRLRADSASIVTAGAEAAKTVVTTTSTRIANLYALRGGALAAFETATSTAAAQIRQHRPSGEELRRGEQQLAQELSKLSTGLIQTASNAAKPGGTSVTERFKQRTNARATKALASVDDAALAKHLADASTGFEARTAKSRTLVSNTYNDAIRMASAPAANKLRDATAHWKTQTQGFQQYAIERSVDGLKQHTQLTAQLPDKLERAAIQGLADNHPSLGMAISNAIVGLAKGIVVGAIAAAVVWFFWPFAIAYGTAAGLVALGAVMASFHERLNGLNEHWDSMSGGEKFVGVLDSLVMGASDTFGVTSLEEAASGLDSYSGQDLNPRERLDHLLNGATGTILTVFAIKSKMGGGPKDLPEVPDPNKFPGAEETPGGGEQSSSTTQTSKPAETKPAETKPIDSKPVESKPVDSKPVESKPVEPRPVHAKPADAKPLDATPVDANSVDAKPTESKPAASEPASPESVDSKPAEAKPTEAEPADSGAARSEPARSNTADLETVDKEPNSAHETSDTGPSLNREMISAPGGASVETVSTKKAVVPTGKVTAYPRGKVKPFTRELEGELKGLKREKQAARKEFDKDPAKNARLEKLKALKHNAERSKEMSDTLEGAGISDTPEQNESIMRHLLDVGETVTPETRSEVTSQIIGKYGIVKLVSKWIFLPDGRAYLTTLLIIPRT